VTEKTGAPGAEENSPASETLEQTGPPAAEMENLEHSEHEADSSGDFREPHAEMPADFASHENHPAEQPAVELANETSPAPESRPPREFQREPQRGQRPERRPEPLRPKPWVKPVDFRPAETSAVSQAVAHATEIAETLKQMIDQLDEVLELVEVAERQKLADEREIDELRRALRRIQPPRREPPQTVIPSREPRRDFREQNQRRDESRRPQPEPREPAAAPSQPPPVVEDAAPPQTD